MDTTRMTDATAALRMACAMWLRDAATTLDPAQARWLTTRLATRQAFTSREVAKIAPALLAWADAFDAPFAAVVRTLLTHATAPVPGLAGLDIYARYPGQAARAQAAALNEEVPHG